jgi:hypothetical protein
MIVTLAGTSNVSIGQCTLGLLLSIKPTKYDGITDILLFMVTLVKRELFIKYGIKFPAGVQYREDEFVNTCLLTHDIKVTYLERAFYHYIQHAGGITMQADGRQISMLLEGLMTLLSTLKDSPDSMELQQLYLHTLNIQLETYSKQGPIILQPYQGKLPLRSQYTVACNIKIIIYHLFGITRLCQIYKILNRIILHR